MKSELRKKMCLWNLRHISTILNWYQRTTLFLTCHNFTICKIKQVGYMFHNSVMSRPIQYILSNKTDWTHVS
jgi:hypothetical protein